MTDVARTLGIDFGTSNSSMAMFDPAAGAARIVYDAEGEDKTPSVVFYGADQTVVGKPAVSRVHDGPPNAVADRAIMSIKRHLITPPWIALPDRDPVRPVDVAAVILGKLRDDAGGSRGASIEGVVLTCPAIFDTTEREALMEAANLAAFTDVEVVEEPVAAALAFANGGGHVGRGVLVYDFGGGTFDIAFVARARHEDHFYLALEPDGDPMCGGDDIDMALYRYWDRQAERDLSHGISAAEGVMDLNFLVHCRQRKETLSKSTHATFSTLLRDGEIFKADIDRETFEHIIEEHVQRTVTKTADMATRARAKGYDVDTLLLVGGSSQIPMVSRLLYAALPGVELQLWKHGDVAVALGAAYRAAQVWPTATPTRRTPDRTPVRQRYRTAVEEVWADAMLTPQELDALRNLQHELGISTAEAGDIEREIMGSLKEACLTVTVPSPQPQVMPNSSAFAPGGPPATVRTQPPPPPPRRIPPPPPPRPAPPRRRFKRH